MNILPEGGRPGATSTRAPTTIPHPREMGGSIGRLDYISLPALIELKLAAGRARDEADVVELIRSNPDVVADIGTHLASVHSKHAKRFQVLVAKATEEQDV